MSKPNKHQNDNFHPRPTGPADVITGSEVLLAEEHPEIIDVDGGLAIDGGKLPGRHDDFEGELDQGHPVPGATGLSPAE